MTDTGRTTKRMRSVSLWRTAVGWALVCAGVTGLVLPVIPGIPLLIAGLVVLSARYRWAAVCLRWLKRKVRQVTARKAAGKETVGA